MQQQAQHNCQAYVNALSPPGIGAYWATGTSGWNCPCSIASANGRRKALQECPDDQSVHQHHALLKQKIKNAQSKIHHSKSKI